MKRTILLADNKDDAREKWGRVLQNAGYAVHSVSTPQEARTELESSKIDLVVIDVRLENDDLESDISGLELAADKSFRHIPKIILTGYSMNYEDQRKVWEAVGGEPPAVVAFVGKNEKSKALLDEIRHAFEAWPRLSMLSSKVSEQIKVDHHTIRSEAKWNYGLSLAMSIFGFAVITAGIVAFAWRNQVAIGIVGSATGLILEAIGYLFFTRLDLANRRMDIYHQELLQTYGLEFVLSVAERLPADRQAACIEQALHAVIDSWYPAEKPSARSARDLLSPIEVETKPGQDLPQPSGKE